MYFFIIVGLFIYMARLIPLQLTCMLITGSLIGRLIIQNAEKEDKTISIGFIFIMVFISVYSGGFLAKPYFLLYVADLACMYLGILIAVRKRYWKGNPSFLFNPFNMAAISKERSMATGISDQEIKVNPVSNKDLLLGVGISTVVYCLFTFALTLIKNVL